MACNAGCATCGTDKLCLSCPSGKYLSSGTCLACSYPCSTCTTAAASCDICADTTTRDINTSPKCNCKSGYWNNLVAVW